MTKVYVVTYDNWDGCIKGVFTTPEAAEQHIAEAAAADGRARVNERYSAEPWVVQDRSAVRRRTHQRVADCPVPRVAYSLVELAAALGLAYSTVAKLVSDGEIAHFRIGRRKMVTVEELNRLKSVR